MTVREQLPSVSSSDTLPREQRVGILLEALSIPWLQDKGPLELRSDGIYAAGVLVATVHP